MKNTATQGAPARLLSKPADEVFPPGGIGVQKEGGPEPLPVRVQRKRSKGWKMPPNTVCVTRPGKWGNPFAVGRHCYLGYYPMDQREAVEFFKAMLADRVTRAAAGYPDDLSPLRGKNLACWCKPGTPCHADVLLKAANLARFEALVDSVAGVIKARTEGGK